MEIKGYTDLEITSGKIPTTIHDMIELSNGNLLMIDPDDTTQIILSDDEGENWNTFDTGDFSSGALSRTYDIVSIWYDRANSKVYFVDLEAADDNSVYAWYLDLSDYSENDIGGEITDNYNRADIYIRDGTIEVLLGNDPTVYKWTGAVWQQMDVHGDDIVAISYALVKDADEVYFWGDETVQEMTFYVYDGAGTITRKDSITGYGPPDSKNQYSLAYDGSNIVYCIMKKDGDGKNYLMSYTISTNVIAEVGEYNVALMLDRNTASGIMEKAVHLTEYKIYQLHSLLPYQLHLIATLESGAIFSAITDNYAMTSGGNMWKYEDLSKYMLQCNISMRDMGCSSGTITFTSDYDLSEKMFISITDMFTTAGVSASQIIFEGFVEGWNEKIAQKTVLRSPAQRDLDEVFPSGAYSGRTDEIIVDIIEAYCSYITEGTLSNGEAMGDLSFAGDKSFREILNEFALTDKFIWYLTPVGALYYNDGTVDSGENFTEASDIMGIKKSLGSRAINYANIKGGFVSGVQVSGTVAEDGEDQRIYGKNPYEKTFSHLNTAAKCTTTNTNVLARYGVVPIIVDFSHMDATVGLIQVGETVTFQYNMTMPNVSSDQFGIREVNYNVRQGRATYTISDEIL